MVYQLRWFHFLPYLPCRQWAQLHQLHQLHQLEWIVFVSHQRTTMRSLLSNFAFWQQNFNKK